MAGNMSKTIAFLGTGLMGHPMAKCLLADGHIVRAWNRTFEKAKSLEAHGASSFETAKEAIRGADFIITSLPDGHIVEDILFGDNLADAITKGSVLIDTSSIEPGRARDHAKRLKEKNIQYLDAPVSGGTKGAEAGTLAIMVGGEAQVFEASRDVLAPMGQPVLVGANGAGQLAKLANQAIVAIAIGAVSEATLLMKTGGADLTAFRAALKGGFADSTILQQHGKRMADGDFEPGGRSKLQLKDLKNVLEEAKLLNIKLPIVEEIAKRYERMIANHNGADLDHSALFLDLLDINNQVT